MTRATALKVSPHLEMVWARNSLRNAGARNTCRNGRGGGRDAGEEDSTPDPGESVGSVAADAPAGSMPLTLAGPASSAPPSVRNLGAPIPRTLNPPLEWKV